MSPRKPNPFATVGGKKPDLIVHTAERSATARALAHLFANEPQPRIFARIDGTLVFVVRVPDGGAELRVLSRDHLINFAHDICQPIKRTEQGRVEVSLPDRVAELTLATLTSERLLSTIVGTTTGPILRADGEVCCTPGLDTATGLFVCDAPTLTLPERPTKEDAKRALRQLRAAFATFAYADGTFKVEELDVGGKSVATSVVDLDRNPSNDESAFLHALLTAVCRPVLWMAPAFAYRAPAISGSGVGKGMLGKAPSLVAFGELPQLVSLGKGEEFDKGLAALLLRGGHSVLIDNLNNQTLRSNVLCSALTDRPAFLRIMGLGKLAPVNSTALISLTGCALNIGRDLVRRTVTIDLDARIEDPEQREFKTGFLDDIRARRVELLQYALIILRWARQNPGELKHGKALGGYDQWSAWVRDPLLTLDCPDPVARSRERKIKDPDRINVFDIFETWFRLHFDNWVTASQLNWDVQILLLHGRKHSRQRINHEVRELVGTRIGNYLLQEKKSQTNKWEAAEFRLIKTDSPRAREGFYDQPDEATATSEATATPEAPASEAAASEEAAAAEEPRFGETPARYQTRFQILGPEPDHPCVRCKVNDGKVYLIRNNFGSDIRAQPLHEQCAPFFFKPPDDPVDWQFNREPDAAAAQPQPAAAAASPDAFNVEQRVAVWRNAFAPLSPETEPCPGWRSGEWPRVYAGIKQFLAGSHAFIAARAGWSVLDLFAVHKTVGVAAADCVGALTRNSTNGFVMQVKADGTLQFANGVKMQKRPLDPDLCVPVWSFYASTTA